MQKEKVIATWYLKAGTKMNLTLASGNGPILVIAIKLAYCFVFYLLVTKHTFYYTNVLNNYRSLNNKFHVGILSYVNILTVYSRYLIFCQKSKINKHIKQAISTKRVYQ